jgi:hypothetical protein
VKYEPKQDKLRRQRWDDEVNVEVYVVIHGCWPAQPGRVEIVTNAEAGDNREPVGIEGKLETGVSL